MAFKNPLSFYDRLYLRLFYWKRSLQYDLPENQVGWRSRQNQELRFKTLLEIGDLQGQRILDLGCGLGCLYGYLQSKGWTGEYTGIDLLERMVKKAKRRYPGVFFEKRDIVENPPARKWDYVLINGVFNHRVRDNWDWIGRTVGVALPLAEKGLAFNLLNLETGWLDSDLFYAKPADLEEKVRLWSGGKYKIASGGVPEDMTAYLYR